MVSISEKYSLTLVVIKENPSELNFLLPKEH